MTCPLQHCEPGLHPQRPLPVVIIGNGPSGICLSYFLSGYRPYVREDVSHPNPILHRKLQEVAGQSLLEQDLQYLSEGLEGRSLSPLGLLLDALLRPDGDLGGEMDSLLAWRKGSGKQLAHRVLGKGPVGGAWQMMEGSMVTLSLGEWMELPDLSFRDWMQKRGRQLRNNRATTRDVAQYYEHYVAAKSLHQNFICGTLVTSVEPLESPDSTLFRVQGVREGDVGGASSPFLLYARSVVLATGSYDRASRLGVSGEDLPAVFHTTVALERELRAGRLGPASEPLLVVGAGLTAADAVLMARRAGVPLLHAFRRGIHDSSLVFNQLPPVMFPEYHKVRDMMAGRAGPVGYHGYSSLPRHRPLAFHPGGKCTLQDDGDGGKQRLVSFSAALVLIGSHPDLFYLPSEGRGLAIDPAHPVSARRNPLDIDPFTYESTRQLGLYVLGPLAGDSFVRFLMGGALGAAAALMKKHERV